MPLKAATMSAWEAGSAGVLGGHEVAVAMTVGEQGLGDDVDARRR